MAISIRPAERRDLSALVRLLQQLSLEEPREDFSETIESGYLRAFRSTPTLGSRSSWLRTTGRWSERLL